MIEFDLFYFMDRAISYLVDTRALDVPANHMYNHNHNHDNSVHVMWKQIKQPNKTQNHKARNTSVEYRNWECQTDTKEIRGKKFSSIQNPQRISEEIFNLSFQCHVASERAQWTHNVIITSLLLQKLRWNVVLT